MLIYLFSLTGALMDKMVATGDFLFMFSAMRMIS